MSKTVTLNIDGQQVTVASGTTILEAAGQIGIDIPTICVHEATQPKAVCRTCIVEIQGARLLSASCVTPVEEGMVVQTQTERVHRSRRTILELLNSAVDLSDAPEIQDMLSAYNADRQRFPDAQTRQIPLLDDNPMFVREYSKCVLCWRCVQVCGDEAQYAYAINFAGRGYHTRISTFLEKPLTETSCVFCGQCIGVCPSGALKPKYEWMIETGRSPLENLTSFRKRKRRK